MATIKEEPLSTIAVRSDIEATKDVGSSDKALASAGVDVQAAHKDKALALLAKVDIEFDPSSETAKRVLRKIDSRILPLVYSIYIFMLIDKNSMSYAAIMGIRTDCNLTDSQYSWLGSLVYFGYLAGDIPSMWFMQNYPLAKVFASVIILWGVVHALHAAAVDFASLGVLRFFLGFFEVYTAPAIIIIFGAWYTKKEQVSRLTIWYTCYGSSNILSGLLGWAINQAAGFRWQALFIFYGVVTVVIGALSWVFLAASPTDAWWLTDEEKTIALERVRHNKTGTEVWRFNRAQLKEAFLDVRFWIIFLLDVSLGLPLGGVALFGPTIIRNLGFSSSESMLLNMAPGGVSIIIVLLAFPLARLTNRTVAGVSIFIISIIGCVMMLTIPADYNAARYGGYVLTIQFPNCVPFIVTMMTAGVGGTTKKFAFSSAYQLGYTVGNLIGPQTYRASDAPNYYTAKYTMLAFLVLCALLFGSLGLIHKHWNSKRNAKDAADAQDGVVHLAVENQEFADLTDFNIKSFRYPI